MNPIPSAALPPGSPAANPAWDDAEAAAFGDDELAQVVYASRLLGRDPSLVLAGGGNSSAKATGTDVFGDPVDLLWVKGSGWDMATIERAGFAPLRLDHVARLAQLDRLSDTQMANELRAASLDTGAPAPSVESILHATLPHRFVLHSHADAVLALTNTGDGERWVREALGDGVVVVPYVMPGFVLAKLCAELFPAEATGTTIGMVLLNHGLFTFADDARTAYENHVDLVDRALELLGDRAGTTTPSPGAGTGAGPGAAVSVPRAPEALRAIAQLRRDVAHAAGFPVVLHHCGDDRSRTFAARTDVDRISQVGTATPDHVLRTKRVPLLGRDVAAYAEAYQAYVERHRDRLGDRDLVPVDPAPRVVIDPALGVLAAGRRVADARTTAEVYAHTTWVIEQAESLGGYHSVAEDDLFDVEYWELEQAKLARQPAPAPFTGEVALVTGAASGIGRACAERLLADGAAVVGIDLDRAVEAVDAGPAFLGVQGDATDPFVVDQALAEAIRRFGGLDVVVVNAGVFPPGEPLATLRDDTWQRAMDVNATGALRLLRAAHPYLALAPEGGRVVVVASKNVPAPGPGVAAYSASKAALTQVARVAALEWGADGIRVNVVHPDAVFDTGLWSEDLIAARAARYGLTPEEYRVRNVLRSEVASSDVAAAVAALCGPSFALTTGAQIPVDGGNDRVI
jgi:rhamnose utilization protein RhaD (predicted bifunctional aldolase and dehydrogenase)/NAD(P)-dependent dehydrogenase (short-subunit alcohol dehydrogenase family)